MEFIYLEDGVYRINLIQYFDEAQFQNPGPEAFVTIYIFRNSDDELMSQHTLSLDTTEAVQYTNIACVIDELQTSRVFYSSVINLNPNLYADPEGYYIQWERCCRNASIKNIVNPIGTGMTYVLEIPPLMKDGKIFKNSSPVLFKPLSDYACINQLYYTEFTGTDPDGDSLVYSLTTPLNSSAQIAVPIPQPKPHFNIAFASGYWEGNMIPGIPPLKISNNGLLTVAPGETGLYVFAIKVEEFRDGVKIGEVRRDFQMLVVDGCDPPAPPSVDVEIPDNPGFDPATDILTYTVADSACFNFLVSNITPGERIFLRANGVNFDTEINEIFSFRDSLIDNGSQLAVQVCIPECPPLLDEPFIVDLIAGDDACPLPQLDTVRLTIQVQPPANAKPVPNFKQLSIVEQEDNDPIYQQLISATDVDNDEIEFILYIENIGDPSLFGFDFDMLTSEPGSASGQLVWDTDCTVYDFSEVTQFDVKVLVNDADQCHVPGDTISIDAEVILPPNTDPLISVDQVIPSEIDLGNTIEFMASATDLDGDDIALRFVGGNFNPEAFGITFTDVEGNTSISSAFSWDLECNAEVYEDGQEFELIFIADDDDKCKEKNFDTLRQIVKVNYPDNEAPSIQIIQRFQRIRVNEPISIQLNATDRDNDEITLELDPSFRQPPAANFAFESVTGFGNVSSVIEWMPECFMLRSGENSTIHDAVFLVSDNACPVPQTDTLKVTFEIFDDAERRENFLPPNVFTPNGDGLNDTFSLSGNFDPNQNLPPDNCDNFFEYIVINNRAGVTVFESENRDFVWKGDNLSPGVYYYLIKYSSTEFKGFIHLMR